MDFKTQYKAILCYMKADVMPMVSYAIIFKNKSYGFSKSTESEILAMLAKIRVVQKKSLLQFCILTSDMNRNSKDNVLFIWRLETQNCRLRVLFFDKAT